MRFSKARFRVAFVAIPEERTAGAKVFLAGGIFFFLFSGFRRQRFESFSGLRFACFGHESCCCLRLSRAVFQGQISSCFRTDSRGAFLPIVDVFLAMSEYRRVSWDAPQAAFCWGLRGGLQVSKFFVAPRFSLLEAFFSFFLVGSVGNVSRVFRACVSRALGTNPAAV